jgi:ferredoxin
MIETTIYYFTGTGNSLNIAKSLAEKIEKCELIPIAKIWQNKNIVSTSGRIGFVFPLYYSGLPKIVYDFVSKIDVSDSEYFFSVVTSAGDVTDLPLQQIAKLLQEKSKTLNAGFLITMPNNYIIGYDIHPEARQKEFFENASKQLETITRFVNFKENNLSNDIIEKDLSRADKFNSKFREDVNEGDKSFYADDNCNNCGTCEEICPMDNIILEEGKPQWLHRCQQCLACINFCPEKAIQIGKSTLTTQRYHHPEITVEDIKNQKNQA